MIIFVCWNFFKVVVRLDFMSSFLISCFDDMFCSLVSQLLWCEMEMVLDMCLDVIEKDNVYLVKVDLFGVDKGDIEVLVEGNQVVISVEVKCSIEQKDDEYMLCSECYYGKVYCIFSLLVEIDSVKVDVYYEGGVFIFILFKSGNGVSWCILVS